MRMCEHLPEIGNGARHPLSVAKSVSVRAPSRTLCKSSTNAWSRCRKTSVSSMKAKRQSSHALVPLSLRFNRVVGRLARRETYQQSNVEAWMKEKGWRLQLGSRHANMTA